MGDGEFYAWLTPNKEQVPNGDKSRRGQARKPMMLQEILVPLRGK